MSLGSIHVLILESIHEMQDIRKCEKTMTHYAVSVRPKLTLIGLFFERLSQNKVWQKMKTFSHLEGAHDQNGALLEDLFIQQHDRTIVKNSFNLHA